MSDPCPLIRDCRRTMLRAASASVFASGLLAIWSAHCSAQALCLSREKLAEFLLDRHSEKRVGAGLETGGHLFEIFATANGSTWTMVMTNPNGTSCVVATGLEWQKANSQMPDRDT